MKLPVIKYCGNQTLEDYELVAKSLAHYIGFVFFKESKRYVTPESVAGWIQKTGKAENKKLVGVFVNPQMEDIERVLEVVPLDIIQLHGIEFPQWIEQLKKNTNIKVWKAIHHTFNSLEVMRSYYGIVDGFVIDCKTNKLWGGTGLSFDWSFIPEYQQEAHYQGVPCLIAGGVSPQNIEHLLAYEPMGIDMASGIEADGRKSDGLIQKIERKVVERYEHIS